MKGVMMSKFTVYTRTAIPGGIIGMALSYAVNKSLVWAALHGFCGWIYVLYWLFSYTEISEWINQWVVY
jgi:hypothetical protein